MKTNENNREKADRQIQLTLTDMFYGQNINQIICSKCKKIYHEYEPFCGLSLSIPEKSDKKYYKNNLNLYDCFEYYGKPDNSKLKIETKIILAKKTDRVIAAFNPVLEIEIEDGENEIETEYTAGLTYKLNKLLHAGIELKGSSNGHYWGPVISHGLHDVWFSLGSAFVLGTIKENKPEMEIRMIIGVGIK